MTAHHPQGWFHPKLQLNYSEPHILFFQEILYTTEKVTSLLLYPTYPYIIKDHLHIYPTPHTILIAQRIHSFPKRYHTNGHSLCPFYAVPNNGTKMFPTDNPSILVPTQLYTSVYFIWSSMPHMPHLPLSFPTPIIKQAHEYIHFPHKWLKSNIGVSYTPITVITHARTHPYPNYPSQIFVLPFRIILLLTRAKKILQLFLLYPYVY